MRTINGIRPYNDVPCSECEEDTIDADMACAMLVAPVWPNQIMHSASGPVSYAMPVIHKRMQAALYGGVVYEAYLKETPQNTPRDWVRPDIWNDAYDAIWNLFAHCGPFRNQPNPRALFPKWVEHKGLCAHWCKAVTGYNKPLNNAYADKKVPEILADLELEFPQLRKAQESQYMQANPIADDDWWLLAYNLLSVLASPDVTPDNTVPLRSKNGLTHWFADVGDAYMNTPNMTAYRRKTPIHIAWVEIVCEQHFRPNMEVPDMPRDQIPDKIWDRWQYCYVYTMSNGGQDNHITFEATVGDTRSYMYFTACTVHEKHRNSQAILVVALKYKSSTVLEINSEFEIFHPAAYKALEYLRIGCTFCDVSIQNWPTSRCLWICDETRFVRRNEWITNMSVHTKANCLNPGLSKAPPPSLHTSLQAQHKAPCDAVPAIEPVGTNAPGNLVEGSTTTNAPTVAKSTMSTPSAKAPPIIRDVTHGRSSSSTPAPEAPAPNPTYGLGNIDENAPTNVFPALTEQHVALLANDPGALTAAVVLPAQGSVLGAARHGSSVSASETPLFNPSSALNYVSVVPNYAQFVGQVKDTKSPMTGNAYKEHNWGRIVGSEAYVRHVARLYELYGHLPIEKIDAWTQDEWDEVAQTNYESKVEVLDQCNAYEEGQQGKRLYAYMLQIAILPNKYKQPEVQIAMETHHCPRSIHNDTDEGALLEAQYALPRIPVELKDNYCPRFAVGRKGYKVGGIPIKGQQVAFTNIGSTGPADGDKKNDLVCVWDEEQIRRMSEFVRNWYYVWKQQEQHKRSTLVDIEFYPLSDLDETNGDPKLRVKTNWREHGVLPRLIKVLEKFDILRRNLWQIAKEGKLRMWRGEFLPATKSIPFGDEGGIKLARCIKQIMHPMYGAPTDAPSVDQWGLRVRQYDWKHQIDA